MKTTGGFKKSSKVNGRLMYAMSMRSRRHWHTHTHVCNRYEEHCSIWPFSYSVLDERMFAYRLVFCRSVNTQSFKQYTNYSAIAYPAPPRLFIYQRDPNQPFKIKMGIRKQRSMKHKKCSYIISLCFKCPLEAIVSKIATPLRKHWRNGWKSGVTELRGRTKNPVDDVFSWEVKRSSLNGYVRTKSKWIIH